MDRQAWPFLVSRNKSVGYRAVVAPDFMVEAQAVHLLADQTQGTITEAGTALCQEIHHDKVGKLTLIYRIARATEGDQSLTDGFGRPVNQIAGLVLKGAPEGAVVTEEHLQEAYKHLQEPFRDFWEQTAARPAFPSQAIDLQSISDKTTPLELIKIGLSSVKYGLTSLKGKPEKKFESLDQNTWKYQFHIEFGDKVDQVIFSSAYNILAVLVNNEGYRHKQKQYIFLWDYVNKKEVFRGVLGNLAHFGAMNFYPDSGLLALVDNDELASQGNNKIWLWDTVEKKDVKYTRSISSRIYSINISPDGRFIACGTEDGYIYLWDSLSDEWTREHQHIGKINTIAFSNDGKLIISGGEDGKINICSLLLNMLKPFHGAVLSHKSPVNAISMSTSGVMASSSQDGTIKIWNLNDQYEIMAFTDSMESINTINFLPDGETLVGGGSDRMIRIWSLKDNREIAAINRHRGEILSVTCDRTGKLIASGGRDRQVIVWTRNE